MIIVVIFMDYCSNVHVSPDNSVLSTKDLQPSNTIYVISLSTTQSVSSDTIKAGQQAGSF